MDTSYLEGESAGLLVVDRQSGCIELTSVREIYRDEASLLLNRGNSFGSVERVLFPSALC